MNLLEYLPALSELTFKVLFIAFFIYSEKRHARREEILLKKLEDLHRDEI